MSSFGGFGTGNPANASFNFGSNKPTGQVYPTFSTPTTTQTGFGSSTFGTTGGITFGSTTQPSSGFQIGAPQTSTTTTGITFGNPTGNVLFPITSSTTSTAAATAMTTTAPAFGTLAPTFGLTTPSTGLNFGTTSTGSGFKFGGPAVTTASTGFNFGATTTTTTAGLSLGQPLTTQATSLTFNLPKTTGTLSFGTTVPTTTTASFGFGFGTTSTASTTTPLSFGLSTNPTTLGLGGGSLFAPKTTGNLSLSTSTTTTTSIGLGGVDNKQAKPGLSGLGSTEPKAAKDNALPEPILQTLNEFQTFTKQQKSISVEISHGSSRPLRKVQEDTEALKSLLATITSGFTRNSIAVDKLKTETAQGLHQAEMAQRMHEAPPGLHYDNSAPAEYFNDLVTRFEEDTMRLRIQLEDSEKHLRSLTQSSSLSPQELTLAMRRLHETLVVLAAKVQTLHTNVESHKKQYKNMQRIYLKDDTILDPDTPVRSESKKQYTLRSLTGPTPFSNTPTAHHLNVLTGTNTFVTPTPTSTDWSITPQATTNPTSFLPSATNVTTPQPVENTGFQLSKPPLGNKRNKR